MDELSGITWEILSVTPRLAAELLQNVAGNGHVDRSTLVAFERDMRENRWVLNGSPIILSSDNQLLDGRARLHACIRSGSTFQSLIVKGIKADSFETIDSIRKRTLADVLSIRTEIHGRSLGAALRIIWSYQAGIPLGKGKSPGTTALLATLEQRPEIRDSILPALRAMPLLPHGCAIALHHLASRTNPAKADQFMAQIGAPISTDPTDPIVQLRSVLAGLRGQGGPRKQGYILAITIKAWNAFRQERKIKQLRFANDREVFPRLDSDSDWGPLGELISGREVEKQPEAVRSLSVRAVMITPEMAESMLADKGPNRQVSASFINKYARDMLSGRWRLNGQTIKLSKDGQLLDGQHRLEAAKKARRAFPAIIVEGLERETFASLDIGHRRAVSDILRERGESNTITLASSLRWLWMIDNNVILAKNSSPTNGELLEILERNPSIRDSIKKVATIRDMMGGGVAAALHRRFSRKDSVKADEFFARLIDGIQLAEQSPVRHLRERLIRMRSSQRVRLGEAEKVALSIKAWNAYREDRTIQLLTWRNRGVTRESLPAVN